MSAKNRGEEEKNGRISVEWPRKNGGGGGRKGMLQNPKRCGETTRDTQNEGGEWYALGRNMGTRPKGTRGEEGRELQIFLEKGGGDKESFCGGVVVGGVFLVG